MSARLRLCAQIDRKQEPQLRLNEKDNTNLNLVASPRAGGNLLWTDHVHVHVAAAAVLLGRGWRQKTNKKNKIREMPRSLNR